MSQEYYRARRRAFDKAFAALPPASQGEILSMVYAKIAELDQAETAQHPEQIAHTNQESIDTTFAIIMADMEL